MSGGSLALSPEARMVLETKKGTEHLMTYEVRSSWVGVLSFLETIKD